jgi:DNA-binding IclR family transcriptional regulator
MNRLASSGSKEDQRYNIRVLDRAFRILTLLTDGKPRTPAEISESIDLNPSTTFRMLYTLSYHRYVRRNETTNQYQLGLACLELAQGYTLSDNLRRVALPELEALRDETKETVHLVVLDQMHIVYIEKIPGLHAIGIMSSRVGRRAPAYCTGVGKVLLAYLNEDQVRSYYDQNGFHRFTSTTITDLNLLMQQLAQVRCQGYAVDKGEHEDEVRCVAAPIFDMEGKAVAAISISGPALRMDPIEENYPLIERAKETALRISQEMGYLANKSGGTKGE